MLADLDVSQESERHQQVQLEALVERLLRALLKDFVVSVRRISALESVNDKC